MSSTGKLCRFVNPQLNAHAVFRYERISWIPVLITFIIALGVGGKNLGNPPPAEPATAVGVLTFAATLAGFAITFSGLSSDFTTYYRSDVSGWV